VRLQLRRPLAATAVLFAAVGTAVITTPSPALAATAPARVVSVAPAVPGPAHPSAAPVAGAPAAAAAPAPAADPDAASSPTLGETIKRIRLWQSLTSMGILVGSLVLVKRLALRR
jgi:hypothetical protein